MLSSIFFLRFFFVPKETNMERTWNEDGTNMSRICFMRFAREIKRMEKVTYSDILYGTKRIFRRLRRIVRQCRI